MSLDPSVILAQKPPDILGTLSGVQALKNAQVQNQLMTLQAQKAQAELAGQRAYGQAFLNTKNPDGSPNVQGALGAYFASPGDPLYAGEAVNQNLAQQRAQAEAQQAGVSLSTEQLKNYQAHADLLANGAGALLKAQEPGPPDANGNPTMVPKMLDTPDVTDAIDRITKSTQLSAPEVKQFQNDAANFTSQIGPALNKNDPMYATKRVQRDQQIRAGLQQILLQAQGNSEQINKIYGAKGVLDKGPGFQGTVQDPFTGAIKQNGAPVGKDLSPEVATSPAPAPPNPITHAPQQQTRAQFAANAAHGPVVTGNAPGVEEEAGTAAQQGVTAYNQAAGDVAQSAARINALRTAINSLKNTKTGPGTAELNNVKSFILANAPAMAKVIPGFDPNSVTNYDIANKYMTQYAAGAAAQYGRETDYKLATAASGSASTHINQLAADDVLKVNVGLERAKQAAVQAFDKTGQPKADFPSFAANWARTTDPRAFMLDQMTAAQRNAMIDKMNPTEKKNFIDSMRKAQASGAWSPADLQK